MDEGDGRRPNKGDDILADDTAKGKNIVRATEKTLSTPREGKNIVHATEETLSTPREGENIVHAEGREKTLSTPREGRKDSPRRLDAGEDGSSKMPARRGGREQYGQTRCEGRPAAAPSAIPLLGDDSRNIRGERLQGSCGARKLRLMRVRISTTRLQLGPGLTGRMHQYAGE